MKLIINDTPTKNGEQESYVQLPTEIMKNGFGTDGKPDRVESLPEQFKKQGYLYTLIKRNEFKALYSQESLISGVLTGYELFYIRLREREKAGKMTGEWYERFPHNEAFGDWAKTLLTKDEKAAIERYNQMTKPGKRG